VQRKSTHALFECVPLDAAQVEAQGREDSGVRLNRSLGIASLAMLGVGNAIGAGIFVLTGTAAAQHAGPGIAISYLIAGLVCALTSLCYAELSSLIPSAGGAFAYARVSIGKLGAWLIGWCMIAEYLLAGATVAVGWSGYAGQSLCADVPCQCAVFYCRKGRRGTSLVVRRRFRHDTLLRF
jgi:APA family basic amino acid/polyamine antiporter